MQWINRISLVLVFASLPFGIFGETVLNGLEVVSGPKGTAITLSGDGSFAAEFSAEGRDVQIDIFGVSYGLDQYNYEQFGECPVRRIRVVEKSENALRLTVGLETEATTVRAKEKDGRWIALLSSVPAPSCAWRANTPPKKTPAKQPLSGAGDMPDRGDEASPSITSLTVLQRGAVAEVRISGEPSVEVGAKVVGRKAVAVFMGVANGLGIQEVSPPVEYGFGTISVLESSRNGVPIVKVSVTALDENVVPMIQTFSGEWVVYIPNRNGERFAVWEVGKGNLVAYDFRQTAGSAVDYREYSLRARDDLERDLSNESTFLINGTRYASVPPAKTEEKLSGGGGSFGTEETAPKDHKPVEAVHESPMSSPMPEHESPMVETGITRLEEPIGSDAEPVSEPVVESVLQLRVPVVIIGNGVNLRSSPNAESPANVIDQLELGRRATKLMVRDEWVRILPKNGDTGWVHESLVKASLDSPVEIAHSEPEPEVQAKEPLPKRAAELPPAEAAAVALSIEDVSEDFRGEIVAKEELPEPAKPRMIRYRRFGRDPFVPLDIIRVADGDSALPDAEDLVLVGIVYDDKERIALLEDTENQNKAYALMEGDRVRRGSLFRIMRKRVIFLLSEEGISYTHDLELEKEKILKEARRR